MLFSISLLSAATVGFAKTVLKTSLLGVYFGSLPISDESFGSICITVQAVEFEFLPISALSGATGNCDAIPEDFCALNAFH